MDTNFNWEALAAIGTILSAIVALGIAVFAYLQSTGRERKSREKEAIEKILTPIRKELHSFSLYKWDNWYSSNRWNKLEDKRLDFPLQYFWLDDKIKQSLENFEQQSSRFNNLSQQRRSALTKVIADTFRNFLQEGEIAYEIHAGDKDVKLDDDNIIHAHWSCVVGGGHSSGVTLYSLVMWGKSLSEYLEERKENPNLPNKNIDFISFSIHNPSTNIKVSPTQEQSDELLSRIEKEIKKYPELVEYRKRWQELYSDGFRLIGEIDHWLSQK